MESGKNRGVAIGEKCRQLLHGSPGDIPAAITRESNSFGTALCGSHFGGERPLGTRSGVRASEGRGFIELIDLEHEFNGSNAADCIRRERC